METGTNRVYFSLPQSPVMFYFPSSSRSMRALASGACLFIFSGNPNIDTQAMLSPPTFFYHLSHQRNDCPCVDSFHFMDIHSYSKRLYLLLRCLDSLQNLLHKRSLLGLQDNPDLQVLSRHHECSSRKTRLISHFLRNLSDSFCYFRPDSASVVQCPVYCPPVLFEPIIIVFVFFDSINPFFPGEFQFLNQLVILIEFRNCQRAAAVYNQIAVFVLHTADES